MEKFHQRKNNYNILCYHYYYADRYIISIVGEFIGTDTVRELLLCSKQDFIMQEFARQTILSYQNVP